MATKQLHPEEALRHVLSVLGHLGWSLARVATPRRIEARRDHPAHGAEWFAHSLPDGQTLVVLSLACELPDLRAAFERYEDLADLHRHVFRALADNSLAARYLLLLGGQSAHLIDLDAEDVLLAVASREEAGDRLYPLLDLQSLSRGSLTAFPRKPLLHRARELANWTHLWSARIGSAIETTPAAMAAFFEWLHLARFAEQHRIGPAGGLSFADFATPTRATAARRFLDDRLHALHTTWHLLQGDKTLPTVEAILRGAREELLASCLASYGLLGRSRFAAEVFTEAFADEELRHVSWKSSVTADERRPVDGEAADEAPPEVAFDLDRHGCVQLLRTVDRLVEWTRADALAREAARERGERPGMQLDLLSEATADVFAVREAARHVLRRVLTVETTTPARAALARMLVLARACEWHARLECRDLPFPRARIHLREVAATRPGEQN